MFEYYLNKSKGSKDMVTDPISLLEWIKRTEKDSNLESNNPNTYYELTEDNHIKEELT